LSIGFVMPGAHRVLAQGHQYEVEAKAAEGLLSLAADGRLDRFRLTAGGISAQEPGRGAVTIDSLYATLGQPAPDASATIPASLSFDLGAETITLPPDPRLALGPKLDHVAASGRLEGPPPRGFDAASLAAWRDAGGAIEKTYSFKGWLETVAFVDALAWTCHVEDHHPELHVQYDRCKVRFSTHSAGGISANDFICAAKADALVAFLG
jgi:4a-hydroxytetrahydrobiopterin dehydratase